MLCLCAYRYISTFRAGFIGHLKYCWACRMIWPLTCGASAAFWWKCTLVNRCLPVLMKYACSYFSTVHSLYYFITCINSDKLLLVILQQTNEQLFYGRLIQDNPGEPVLSQGSDLLEQPLDFCEPDVLVTPPGVSKHYRKTQWFGCLLFYRHGISTPCLLLPIADTHTGNAVLSEF